MTPRGIVNSGLPLAVAVVIATKDRAPLLRRCVAALAKQSVLPSEIAIVDDGSRDDTPDAIRGFRFPEPTTLRGARNARSRGPAAARNRGVRLTTAPLVAFTDDDAVPDRDWLAELVRAVYEAPAAVGGIGGRVQPVEPGLIADYMTRHRILEPPESLKYLVTVNCIYRREALETSGGFDERVRSAGGEDPGLAMRVRAAGWTLGYEPRAVVAHHYRESVVDFARTFFRYGRGCRRVMG